MTGQLKRILRSIRFERSIHPHDYRRNRGCALSPLPPSDPYKARERRIRAELARSIAEAIVARDTFGFVRQTKTTAPK